MKKLLPKCKEWRMNSLFSFKVFMLLAMIVGGANGVWAQTVISTFTMPSDNPTAAYGPTIVDGKCEIGSDGYYLGHNEVIDYYALGLVDADNKFVKRENGYKLQTNNIDKAHFKFQFAPGTVQAGDIITVSCNQVYNNNATVGYKVGGSNSEATASWTSGGALVDVSHIIQTNEIITDGENQYIRIGRLADPNQHTGFAKFTITRPAGYQVNFGPNIEGRGTVTATINGEEITSGTRVVSGTQVTFTATPSSSEYLTWGWNVSGDGDKYSESYTHTVTADVTVKQKFTRGWHINATSKNSELGSVTVSGNGQTNTNIHITPYPYTNVTFTASPNAGAELEGWYTDEACTNKVQAEEGKITINGNEVVYDDQKFPDPSNSDNNVLNLWAKFKSIIPTYTVNYDTGLSIPEGCEWWYTVGDDDEKIKGTRTFTAGTKITYHASDNSSANSLFNCWNDNGSYVQYNNKNWTKTGSLSEDLNVKPDFVAAIKYVGNVQNNIGGSVKVYKKDDQGYVTSEEVNGKKIKHWETKGAQFVPEAADGYKFVGWVEGGNDNPYDLSNPTAGTIYTRTAKFVKKAETEVTTSGSTYTFTVKDTNSSGNNNEGYLDNVYRDVPNMTFSIGGENQIPMVANNGSTYDLYVERSSGVTSASCSGNLPTGGTFYKFEPETDGKFSLSGYFKNCGNNNIAQLFVSENGNITAYKQISRTADDTYVTLNDIDVQAGKTYYFYVATTGNGQHFALKSFSYTPTYFFANKSYTITKGSATSFTQQQTLLGVSSGDNVQYSCKVETDGVSGLKAQIDVNTGAVSISSQTDKDGGAVIVTATVNSTTKVSYVITVPYIGEHTWDFHNIANKTEEKTTGTWKLAYEVDKVENNEVKDPVIVIVDAVEGDNAKYISETNGLTVSAKKNNLGLQVTGYEAGSDIGSSDVQKKHDANISDVNLVRHLAFSSAYQKTTITLPQLKKDYYVRVYWKPHAGGQSGSAMKVTNLCDLTGAEVVNTFNVLGTQFKDYDVNKDYDGGTSFIVKEDGDVTMTLQDGSWNKIVKIEVMKDFRTDMTAKNKYRKTTNGTLNLDWDGTKPTNPVTIEANTLDYYRSGSSYTLWLTGAPGQVLAENGAWVTYTTEAYGSDGFVMGDGVQQTTYGWYSSGHGYYNDLVVKVTKGVGNLKVVRDIIYNGYILDRDENWYAVGYLDKQPYPYTWDFTDYNMYKGTTITGSYNDNATTLTNVQAPNYGAWVKGQNATQGWLEDKSRIVKSTLALYNDNTNKTTDNLRDVEKPLHAYGSQPYFGTTPVVETKGLGITYSGNFGLAGTHVRSDNTSYIKIPTVDAGMYVFIKSESKPSKVTNTTEYTDFEKGKNTNVYCYKVTSTGDVDITTMPKCLVFKIGVTDQMKDITYYGWTTESRAIAIDHNETGSFSAVTKAYKVVNTAGWDKTYDVKVKDGNYAPLPSGVHIPAGNGILLENTECTWTTSQGILDKAANKVTVPLFVPAVNIAAATEADLSGNLLVASTTETTPSTSITGTKVTDHDQYYTLSNYYYKVHENNDKMVQTKFVSDPAFYRYIGSGNTLVNKAYLKMTLPTSGSTAKSDNKGFDDSDETTGISEFIIDNEAVEKGNDTYYNVSGQALNSIPVQRGIYIKNGKKIYVK